KVPTNFINASIEDGDAVDPFKQHLWPERVFLRAQHDSTWRRADELFALRDDAHFDYQAHIMAWSRVDFLMAQGEDKVGALLRRPKHVQGPRGAAMFDLLQEEQAAALQQLFGFDAREFDARWRQWVLKTYAKK